MQKAAELSGSAASGLWFAATIMVSTCWLTVFAASVSASTMGCCGMGSTMRRATAACCGTRSGMRGTTGRATSRCYVATPTIAGIGTSVSAAAVVSSSSTAAEAMIAPAVAVTPVCPGAYAQKDAVIEVARAIKAARRATVRCIVVIAVGTDRLNAYADANLCAGCWRQAQWDQQRCRAGQKQTAHGELMSPARYAFNLPHVVILPTSVLSIQSFRSKLDSSSIGLGLADRWSIRTVGGNGQVWGVIAGPKRE
jgi:hypothetical protein